MLQIESIIEQKTNMHKSLQSGFAGILGLIETDAHGNLSL